MREQTQKSLDLLRKMLKSPEYSDIRKAWTQPSSSTSGLQNYNLERPSKKLFPRLTPLRNQIPRYKVTGGNAINWRAVTGINTGTSTPGVSEGNRNEFIAHTTADFTRKFAGLGHEDYLTFEAGYSGEGFEDVRALAMELDLVALMISEEFVLLGGNATLALGTPGTITFTNSTTGGTIGNVTIYAKVIALTLEGLRLAGTSGPVVTTYARTNADGSTDTVAGGSSQASAEQNSGALGGSNTSSTVIKVPAVRGAVAYAWYLGTSTGNANLYLNAITTVNEYDLVAPPTSSGQQLSTMTLADNSKNTLEFDGILTCVMDPAGNGYWKSLDNAALTANSDGSIVEIDAALKDRWDNYRLTIEELWVSSQELINLTKKVMAGGTATAFRITLPNAGSDMASVTAGAIVGEYLSKFNMEGGRSIPIRLHPYMPAGTMLGLSHTLPYPVSNVPQVWRMAVRQEYYGQDWPIKSRKYEHGVYVDEVLQPYAPFANIVIDNIKNA